MPRAQPGIIAPVPRHSRYLFFQTDHEQELRPALERLGALPMDEQAVIGLGPSLVASSSGPVTGLREHPTLSGPRCAFPSTPTALWVWLRGDDRGELVHASRSIEHTLGDAFVLETVVEGFQHKESRDLTGYEDGTENPTGDKATEVAFVSGQGAGLDGSSFVAVEQWVHDLDTFDQMEPEERDHVIGRRISDNEEIEDAPESAHVKRTEQESFEPAAHLLRRSMPWSDAAQAGLVFVAFGRSFDAMDAHLRRMVGAEDGVVDALFRFTRPVSGAYFWCPPLLDGRLDLRALGL